MGRMRAKIVMVLNKHTMRKLLGPVLPLLRYIRFLPEKKKASSYARQLAPQSEIKVCYLTNNFPSRPPTRFEITNGGAVKLTFLSEYYPHSYPDASILYTVSSVNHVAKNTIVSTAKKKGVKVILNQNGVAYPAWEQDNWKQINNSLRTIYKKADYIIFQSKFCEISAKKFLGEINTPSQIIYNSVDLDLYHVPGKRPATTGPVILLGGNQYEKYRFESAIDTLAQTVMLLPNAHLLITGKLWGDNFQQTLAQAKSYIQKCNLSEKVDFIGSYTQSEAKYIFQRAHLLIHTKYNDPSPNLISEALASGLPVIYSSSGGVPELVGNDAGIGVSVPHSWETINTPDPTEMAKGIQTIWENLSRYSDAARQRAIENFGMDTFIKRHKNLFENILR